MAGGTTFGAQHCRPVLHTKQLETLPLRRGWYLLDILLRTVAYYSSRSPSRCGDEKGNPGVNHYWDCHREVSRGGSAFTDQRLSYNVTE